MSAHLLCLTSSGGLPIFARTKGNAESLPFSIMGSLNGVHMFSKSRNIDLLNTLTDDHIVVWKEFHDSVVLIGIATGATVKVLETILQSAFNAMVLVVSFDEIKSQRNVDRLKRELRVCYPIIDRLLNSLDYNDTNYKNSSDLVQLVECIYCPENHLLQIVLNSYTECVDSMYSCILVHGKVSVATESWWDLSPDELKLLSLLATVENTSSSKDIPVFLPHKSPNAAFRFVCVTLIPDVQVCCLCGPTPSLEEIQHSAAQCFKSSFEILGAVIQYNLRYLPGNLQLDSGILGLLLINTNVRKYTMLRNSQQTGKRSSGGSHRLDILKSFYYQAVLDNLDIENSDINKEILKKNDIDEDSKKNTSVAKETYWCSEYHKCHAIRIDNDILCVLYNSSVPTPALRLISERTLKGIVSDKQSCW